MVGRQHGCGVDQTTLTHHLPDPIHARYRAGAFGDEVGFVVTWLLILNQVADIPLYAQLFTDYLARLLPASYAVGWLPIMIKLGVIVLTCALNIVGVEALEVSAALLTTLILAPFVVLPIAAGAMHMKFDWAALGTAGIPASAKANLPLFLSTILWCMQVRSSR